MERLEGSLRRALRGAGVPDAGALAAVTRAWPDAVGPAIARAAWPQRIARDGTLHVTTVSSTWSFELARMEEEVRAKLRAAIGDTTPPSLRFAPGPVPSPGEDERPPRAVPSPSPEDDVRAASLSAAIEDPELREAVRRAVAASLAAARADRAV
jgi:predicted nucleic acid-binding Zn ribbon protein